jgi:crossover junction endodeoxyribonuclease RuvC
MRVMGIDPGLQNMGWGVIEVEGPRVRHVANGVVHSSPRADLARRLLELFDGLTAVVSEQGPDRAAVEQTFVNRDGAGTLKLGQARAVALLVPARAGIPVGEYAPNAVKKAVVGVGLAAKEQVDHMVRLHLPGARIDGPDAADALAVAICHAHHLQSATHLAKAIAEAEDRAADERAEAALANLARTIRKVRR